MSENCPKATTVEFVIESVLEREGLVFARRIARVDFVLRTKSRLGSTLVERFVVPRKVRPDGTVDLELFCFRLADELDDATFPIGATVLFYE